MRRRIPAPYERRAVEEDLINGLQCVVEDPIRVLLAGEVLWRALSEALVLVPGRERLLDDARLAPLAAAGDDHIRVRLAVEIGASDGVGALQSDDQRAAFALHPLVLGRVRIDSSPVAVGQHSTRVVADGSLLPSSSRQTGAWWTLLAFSDHLWQSGRFCRSATTISLGR